MDEEIKQGPRMRRRSEACGKKQPDDGENAKVRNILAWVRDIGIAVVVALVLIQFVTPTIVDGSSMEPNLHDGDYLIMSKQSYGILGGEPEYGDVVVVHTHLKDEKNHEKLIIKRVIGLPGDEITIENGTVYVNGQAQDDSYTKDQVTNGIIEGLIVPEGSIFCLGDNRLNSKDSRAADVGCISEDDIVGKVVLRLLPLNKLGTIYNPYGEQE